MARVLIVDDVEIVRKALEAVIRRMGHTPVAAASGTSGRELALRDPPDLALIDFQMPDMDGAQLFGVLRAELGERCPRVLFVSATPPDEVAARVEQVGHPAGYVKKPFHLDELMALVAAALAAPAPSDAAPALGAAAAR
jgi:CheY-like chemotaxis protein